MVLNNKTYRLKLGGSVLNRRNGKCLGELLAAWTEAAVVI